MANKPIKSCYPDPTGYLKDFQKSVPFDDSNRARGRSLALSFFSVTGDQPVNKRIN